MDDLSDPGAPKRGMSASHMRAFTCKDCRREVEGLEANIAALEKRGAPKKEITKARSTLRSRLEKSTYNENWARGLVERGGSRSDRCREHRDKHRVNIQGLAVAYIDLATVGEVADLDNPTGPLGGLGPMPTAHEEVPGTTYNLENVRVGMTDEHIIEMVARLRDKQVLILKAGTGTGKSTFAPYRLMDPPPVTLTNVPADAPFAKLTDLGPIIVTEPRVQAAVGVASFVGGVMSGAGGVGPGYPVGYQVSGDRNHDDACELVYVTDGTMINWLREGRLSRIGTVIVDEAHERSTNIDFIMGYLKRELPRYPHLRVIVTSATFNTDFYLEYFGGPTNAHVMEVPPEKAFGYGMPFFPNLDAPDDGEEDVLQRWLDPALPLIAQAPRNIEDFIRTHWKSQYAEALHHPDDVVEQSDDGFIEDVWETTRLISDLRFTGKIPVDQWQGLMPKEIEKFVVALAQGLDEMDIFGDILGFLPTRRTIEPVCEAIERALGPRYKDQVFPLISSLPKERQRQALAKRRRGESRKIIISTNLAETSLTVEGVRFVVDSGIIAQSEWDPELAKGSIPTKPHSQAGIRQRWGRVGRKAPGWVFPLYTKAQLLDLAEDTPPGSTRDNLEALVMTAKVGGIDDVLGFDWPAAFQPTTVQLDDDAAQSRDVFVRELRRADNALRSGGAVDVDGHPTSFGKELVRFQGLGSTASALAILYADRLACVPEVAAVIALLEDTRLIGQGGLLLDDFDWPDEWRLEAADRHRGFASLCEDDAELVLLIGAAWERSDPDRAPWDDSSARQDWARMWWVNHSVLLEAAQKRQEVLGKLSPAMKEEVKRFLEPALINRVRGVVTRAMATNVFARQSENEYRPVHTPGNATDGPAPIPMDPHDQGSPEDETAGQTPTPAQLSRAFLLEPDSLLVPRADRLVALRRRESKTDNRISSLLIAQEWAITKHGEEPPSSAVDAMQMVIAASKSGPADAAKNHALAYLDAWPVGQRVQLDLTTTDGAIVGTVLSEPLAPFPRPKSREERGDDPREGRNRRSRMRGSRSGDAEQDASRDDASTEMRLGKRQGYDDEQSEQAALVDADRNSGLLQACGLCFPCVDDRPEDCEHHGDETPSIPGEDPTASWRALASAGVDVSTPRIAIDGGATIASDSWYEVVGYSRDEHGITVMMRPDWRRGQSANAGQHPDLQAGDPIEVRVGQALRHHGGALRAFDRVDGKGRFILAEARSWRADEQVRRREIAVSLDRANATLLEGLILGRTVTATTVPARAEGTLTITLLELLHQHWTKAEFGRGASNEVIEKRGRNARVEPVHTAVVDSPPNANGYGTARLLHQDSELGIVHRFDFRAKSQNEEGAEGPGPSATEVSGRAPALAVGTALMLKLRSDKASLDVSGLSVAGLREIASQQAGQITINGLPDDDGQAPRRGVARGGHRQGSQEIPSEAASAPADGPEDDDDDNGAELAPAGTEVVAKTERPLSRSAAEALVALSDDPDWPNEVWSFWARSHHLLVDRRTPIPGTLTEPFESRATVRIDRSTPAEQREAQLDAFANAHPVGSQVAGVVTSMTDSGVWVKLEDGVDGFVPTGELSWANRVRHPDQVVAAGDRIRALVRELPTATMRMTLSVKALSPDPYEVFKARHRPGSRLTGTIAGRVPGAVFLDLGDDVDGSIRISELDHVRLETAETFSEIGAHVEAEVVAFDDEKRRVVLSRKRTLPHPYDLCKSRAKVGDKVRATVTKATRSHVYLTLSNGASAAIHVNQLAAGVSDASTKYAPGDPVVARIITFNDDRQQLELSVRALLYEDYKARHTVGGKVRTRVTRTTVKHVYVQLTNGAAGVVLHRDLAHGGVPDASQATQVGAEMAAQILRFDDNLLQVELSVKALLPDPFVDFQKNVPVGTTVRAIVTGFNDSFAYVTLRDGAQGSIHVSQISAARVGRPADALTEGQRLEAVVVGFNERHKKVELSLRSAAARAPQPAKASPRKAPLARPDSTTPPMHRSSPRSLVAEGPSVEEAVADGCRQLGVPRSLVQYEVLDPGQSNTLFRRSRPAKVRVTSP